VDQLRFFALVDLDRNADNCIGVITAQFHAIDVKYITYDSETNLPAKLRQEISVYNHQRSPQALNLIVIFEAHRIMINDADASNSLLEIFSSHADYEALYIPLFQPETQRGNILDCYEPSSGYTFFGSAKVVTEHLQRLDTGVPTDGTCIIQHDYEHFFFGNEDPIHVRTVPLVLVASVDGSVELGSFFRRRYPKNYRDVAEKLFNTRYSTSIGMDINMNCASKLPVPSLETFDYKLTVYWINLSSSHDRRQLMEEHLNLLAKKNKFRRVRMEATNKVEMRALLKYYKLPQWLKVKEHSVTFDDHLDGTYSLSEFACLSSHIDAIRQAHIDDVQIAIILEDDVRLDDDFFLDVRFKLQSAPVDWQILQLFTVNEKIVHYLRKVEQSNFVDWFPDHWSTAAYVVNREGMEKLMTAFDTLTGASGKEGEQKYLEKVLVADEFLYFHAKTYTATSAALHLTNMDSTIQRNGIDGDILRSIYQMKPDDECQVVAYRPCPASVLVIVSARIEDVQEANIVTQRTIQNINSLKICVPHVEASMMFVVRSKKLEGTITKHLSQLHEARRNGIRLATTLWSTRYNKFWYVRNILPYLSSFEKVLVIDSDISLTGFPIHDFFASVHGSVIGGALRRGIKDQLLTSFHEPVRQWFSAFSNGDWVHRMDPKIKGLDIAFLEFYFASLDGAFAHWFFSKILEEKMLHENNDFHSKRLESDYGPDVVWCGAAQEWIELTQSSKRPCLLSLFMLLHLDERTIPNQSYDTISGSRKRAKIQSEERLPLLIYQKTFETWFKGSQGIRNFIGGTTYFSDSFVRKMSEFAHVQPTRCLFGAES